MEVDDGHGGKFTFTFNGSMNNNQLSKFNQFSNDLAFQARPEIKNRGINDWLVMSELDFR